MSKSKKSKKDVPLEVIQQWLRDPDCDVRQAAMNACAGRDVPLEVIQQGLRDPDCDVRQAAMKIAEERGIEIQPYRSFEPPARVYKKCFLGVIVVAEIPADAEVRGGLGRKCRSNKANIVEVIGDVCGEPVGISLYDRKATYYAGDEIEVENFDLSDAECSTGYHFFCTIEEARAYDA